LASTPRLETLAAVHSRIISVAAAVMLIAPAGASASVSHVVAAGESLSSIAASDGLSVEQLADANGLSPEAFLLEGSTLTIPSQETGTPQSAPGAGESTSTAEAAAPSAGSYVVQPGDTLSAIAARAGMGIEELAAANGIDPTGPLLAGAVLQVPGGSAESAPEDEAAPSEGTGAQAGLAASSEPVGQAESSTSEPPYPTEETVTPSEVGSTAEANGVPPSLAEAIASQESGFNNNLTSSADARGVMQILPETWRWIGQELAGSTPLTPASAASNVRGGVLLLHSLLEATGGDPSLAAAGYFQGLESVRREGEAPETEEYVNNVLALQHQFGG
jgi:N-acetylmuramoyl-L-alanine amidase